MNRMEALHILGLDEDATPEDVKTAYRETAQILHPDRFANNKKLADRATEQFKNLQDAYDYLKKNPAKAGSRRTSSRSRAADLEARLSGVQAARVQLTHQRDALADERRNALVMIVVGVAVAFLLRRIKPIAGIAGAAVVWGIVQFVSTYRSLAVIDEHLDKLTAEKKQIIKELDEL